MSATFAVPPPSVAPFSVAVELVRQAKKLEAQRLDLMRQAQARLEAELEGKPKALRDLLLEEYIRENSKEVTL